MEAISSIGKFMTCWMHCAISIVFALGDVKTGDSIKNKAIEAAIPPTQIILRKGIRLDSCFVSLTILSYSSTPLSESAFNITGSALSAIASALTILFLFWTITALGRKLVQPTSLAKGIALLGSGVVGALAYTFSDTFWFSAVEGEVYALSSLFTAVVFWLILKWDEHADKEGSDKWLILIAYLMGLSIGVHLLNLLTIPAIVLVYYFRRHVFSWGGVLAAFGVSVGILAVVLYGIIPGVPTIAGWFELLFTNVFGLPFNTGLAVYLVLMTVTLIWSIWESYCVIKREETINARTIISFVLAMALAGVPFIKESAIIGILLTITMLIILFVKKDVIPARCVCPNTKLFASNPRFFK